MARDFTKDAANRLGWASVGLNTIGALVEGAAALSWHCWGYMDSTNTASGDNRTISSFIHAGNNGIRWNIENTDGTRKLRGGGRSTTADTLQQVTATTDLALSTWYSLGGVNNFTGDTVTPYVNGSAENSSAVTFGSNTYTAGTPTVNDAFGAQDDTATTAVGRSWDGRLAEFALWAGDIGAAGFAQLAKGLSALMVRPDLLVLYVPLRGNASPEIDIISAKSPTVSGSLPKLDHPRIIYPSTAQIRRYTTAVAPPASTFFPSRRMMSGVGI